MVPLDPGAEAKICEPGGEGVFFPQEYEHDWPTGVRVFVYAAFLIYLFQVFTACVSVRPCLLVSTVVFA